MSGRILGLYRQIALEQGQPADAILEGLGLASPDPDFITWEEFRTLTERAERMVGSPEALQAIGLKVQTLPGLAPLMGIFRLVTSPSTLYWANFRWGGPRLFPLVRTEQTDLSGGRIEGVITIPDELADCPGFFHINLGFMRTMPRLIGLPDARVTMTLEPRRATYLIQPPPALTIWARVRNAWRTLVSAELAFEELANQNARLGESYREAETAREEAESARQRAVDALLAAEEARNIAVEARHLAEEADRVKSKFLATISHELRTPLNGVVGMASLMTATPLTAEQRGYAQTIRSSGDLLLLLINDLLDLSKIEAGHLEIRATDVSLRETVDEVIEITAQRAAGKPIDLCGLVVSSCPAVVRADALRLRQVLINLVDNAIKFTDRGEVVLRVEPGLDAAGSPEIRFSVSDTGIGIDPDQQRRIFDAFVQGDGSTTRQYGGTGLGLTISDRIVRTMHGEIEVESEPGVGSTFRFALRLPIVQPAVVVSRSGERALLAIPSRGARAAIREPLEEAGWTADEAATVEATDSALARGGWNAVVVDLPLVRSLPALASLPVSTRIVGLHPFGATPPNGVEGVTVWLTRPTRREELLSGLTTRRRDQAPVPPSPPAPRARILIADDNQVNQRVAQRMAERLGHQVQVVNDGEEALRAMELEFYDAVLMDWHMPRLDGLQATARIRERERETGARHQIIIAMTASARREDREACLNMGADDYLAKPAELEDLAAALDRWIPATTPALVVGRTPAP